VLFFDEADAIASRRSTGPTQGFQRESNTVVSVLLRELEAFNGVVIFATNLAVNFDPAFERRIRTHVRFEMPGVDEREQIWKVQIHPLKTPLASDVDFRALSERFVTSGGEIKNAVLKAATAAAAESGSNASKKITQHHLERAMQEVLSAKDVMSQSLFSDKEETPEHRLMKAVESAEQRWRSVAMSALVIAGLGTLLGIIALTVAVVR
jgi:SpoVK/Ycf46/Vps4 family AAA+-type ATPase